MVGSSGRGSRLPTDASEGIETAYLSRILVPTVQYSPFHAILPYSPNCLEEHALDNPLGEHDQEPRRASRGSAKCTRTGGRLWITDLVVYWPVYACHSDGRKRLEDGRGHGPELVCPCPSDAPEHPAGPTLAAKVRAPSPNCYLVMYQALPRLVPIVTFLPPNRHPAPA